MLRLPILILMAVMLLAGCTGFQTLPDWFEHPDPLALERAVSGETLFGAPKPEPDMPDPADLFHLTPEMQDFAEFHTHGIRDHFDRAEALYQALAFPSMRGVRYELSDTFTAAEVFARRQANCLGFTLLYVAMGRHVGLDVWANEVEMPPLWNISDEQVLARLRHVNAKVFLPDGDQAVMDLEMDRYRSRYPQETIDQERLAAQYYNNRAMELAAVGDFAGAHHQARLALMLDGERAFIWNNLASIHARQGLMEEAEAAWLRGFLLERDNLTVISNLSSLYHWQGEPEKSEYFGRRARQYQQSNPYYLYAHALKKYSAGELADAEPLIRRALQRKDDDPRFYRLAARIYDEMGQTRQSEVMLRRGETAREG